MRSNASRVFGLDLIRAFAIVSVLLGHGYSFVSELIPSKYYLFFLPDGVAIFFVLSGFLIGRIVINQFCLNDFGFKSFLNFYLMRWFRTLPAYFFVLSLLIVLYRNCGYGVLPDVWKYYFFVQNILSPHPVFFAEAWSLSVEEIFYLFFPVVLAIFVSFIRRKALAVLFALTVFFCCINYLQIFVSWLFYC